jgi:hypothetical protein
MSSEYWQEGALYKCLPQGRSGWGGWRSRLWQQAPDAGMILFCGQRGSGVDGKSPSISTLAALIFVTFDF